MQKYKYILFIAALYFLIARAGLALTTINHTSSPIWPATGLAIALLYYFGTKYWFGIFLGAFLANFFTDVPAYVAGLICFGNALEAFVGVVILVVVRNWRARNHEKDGEILGIVTASFFASAVSSTTGTLALLLSNVIPADQAQLTWITWWSGDVVGGIVAFPVAMYALRNAIKMNWAKAFKLVAVGLVAFAIGVFVFAYKVGEPYAFLVFLGLLLALYIADELGLYFSFVIVAITSVIFTLLGYGPFVVGSTNHNLMALQLFLGSLGLTTFVLAEFHKFIPLRYLARPLIIGWLISGTIFHTYYQQHVMRDQMRLRSLAREYTSRIENQFQLHRRALRASSGLFTANDNMTRREWKIFTDTLDIKLRFRAMLGIGYIKPVHKSEIAAYEKQRRQLYPDFTIKPVGALTVGSERIKSDWSYIIEFLEPEILRSAIGLDVATEKYRFDAANIARDTGNATLSRNISLRISKNKGAGFLLFVPVYKFGWPVKTIEERRAAHKGWMYAPLLMQDLVATSMEGSKAELDYEVYLKVDERKLLLTTSNGFFSNNPRYNPLVSETTISNQTFIIQWQPNANFISSRDFTLSWVGAMGVLLTLATAWMLMNSQTFMARAETIVQDQTKLISERNHLWQALMESAPVGVMHVDITGDWRYANSRWYELMGPAKTRAEFLSETLPKIHWADREHFNKIWESYLKSGTDIHTEFRLVQHDGSMKWLIVSATGITNDEGQRVGHVCVAIDQTQQKEQALLLEKERARMVESAKMASLGEMAGGMAHEINNPLTIILARSEQLRRMQFEKITREFIDEQTAKIESTAQRIAKIVRGLKAFSRNAESDEMVPSGIKSIMDDTLSLCSEKIKINHINLSVSDLKDWQILCRPSEISQVLLNLITNAFDAISGQPDPWIRIEVSVNTGNLVIRVTDSGTGIPFQLADKIMTPFFTTKEVGKGTGLGLSISKGIVELHGGSLRLDRQNANTSFVIELPLHA